MSVPGHSHSIISYCCNQLTKNTYWAGSMFMSVCRYDRTSCSAAIVVERSRVEQLAYVRRLPAAEYRI
jgi:hypothetical protein